MTRVATYDESPPRSRPDEMLTTLNHLFFGAVERHDRSDALLAKPPGDAPGDPPSGGGYRPISHRTVAERARRVALGLHAAGFPAGTRAAILSENRPEWAIVDYGCLTGGIVDVPLYPTLQPVTMELILRDAAVEVIFVSSAAHAAQIASIRDRLPALRSVVGFGRSRWAGTDITLAALEAGGASVETPERIADYLAAALATIPDDVATIIYTSGTTGDPKGAMLTHGNLASNVRAVIDAIPMGASDVSLSFLPLSHVLERMFDYLMFAAGVSIAYVESMDTLVDNLGEVRPTIVVAVPRVYEKIFDRVADQARARGAFASRIFGWASRVGARWTDAELDGGGAGAALSIQHRLASRLVFAKLVQRIGGRLRYFVSGGAPLAPEIQRFFYAAGLPVLEGYGLTESSPVISVNTPDAMRIGTVGKPIRNVEVRIAADGEILARGPNVMRGYLNRPDATRETIDEDGWLHTGDIGRLEDGFLRITDRKKDIIVTAGGKNIAPQPIENLVRTNKYVAQAVMIGDRRKYPVILVVPEFSRLERWARYEGIPAEDHAALLAKAAVRAKMDREVLGMLTGLAPFERPKRVALLLHDFSIERGELTPTLKVKRRVIDRNYRAVIDSLYETSPAEQLAAPAG